MKSLENLKKQETVWIRFLFNAYSRPDYLRWIYIWKNKKQHLIKVEERANQTKIK